MAQQLSDQFDFKLIEEFPGYNSASDKTKLKPGTLIRGSKNIYKKLSGTLATRPGIKRRGSADSTNAGVKSEFVWETNVGTVRPIRVCNNKLQVESDIVTSGTHVWYDLLETSTLAHPAVTLTRFVFDTFWDTEEVSDRLIAVRGDDKILSWSGGMTKASSATYNNVIGFINFVSIDSGGVATYVVNDILTITGGGGTGATVKVLEVNQGVITAVNLLTGGSGYTSGSGNATTGGGGSGATFNIQAVTTGTITKQGTESWAELGFATVLTSEKKLIINSVEYSYLGGESTTILTGVSPDPTSIVSGDIIIQSVISNSASDVSGYNFDFCKTINNQVWYGSYLSRVVYQSADTSAGTLGFLNLVDGNGHVTGDAASVTLDSMAKGIGEKDGKGIIFAGDSDMYIVTANEPLPVSFTSPTSNAAQYVYNKVEKKKLPGLNSALGHEFIGNFGDSLVWLDQKNQLRALGSFTNETFIKPVHLSLAVQSELTEDDFTGGHVKVVTDTIYITSPNNGRDWMYQEREVLNNDGQISSEKLWQPPQIRGVSRFSVIEGVLYGHSNANPQIYEIWDTNQWFDDSPTDETIPYVCVWRLAYQQHGQRYRLLTFDKVFVEGYMTDSTEMLLNIYFDYKGGTDLKQVIVNSIDDFADFFLGTDAPSIGDSSLGDNPLGDGIITETNDQELLPKFRAIPVVSQMRKFFEYSLEFVTADVGARAELLCIGTNVRLATEQPVFLHK